MKSKEVTHTFLATSTLPEDDELVNVCRDLNIPIFRGHAQSVIDRLLDLAWQNKSGIILRVTGDNLYSDETIIDELIRLVRDNHLDYARANNLPFGVTAEVYTTSYLWQLYVKMENPMVSEYLTWFVLLDKDVKKGCIDINYRNENLSFKNLSIDYPSDLEDCKRILDCSGNERASDINLATLVRCSSELLKDKEDKYMKLPNGNSILTSEYVNRWKSSDYVIRKEIKIG